MILLQTSTNFNMIQNDDSLQILYFNTNIVRSNFAIWNIFITFRNQIIRFFFNSLCSSWNLHDCDWGSFYCTWIVPFLKLGSIKNLFSKQHWNAYFILRSLQLQNTTPIIPCINLHFTVVYFVNYFKKDTTSTSENICYSQRSEQFGVFQKTDKFDEIAATFGTFF